MHFFKFTGKNPDNMGDVEMSVFVNSNINTQTRGVPAIDLDYHSHYEHSLGFRVSIEAIHNNTEKSFFGVLVSVLPSASVYDPGRQGAPKDAFKFIKPEYESGHQHVTFSDGDTIIKGFKADTTIGLSIFIDIKIWDLKKQEFKDYGYTVLPILKELDTDANEDT